MGRSCFPHRMLGFMVDGFQECGMDGKKEVSREERKRLVLGMALSFFAVVALSFASMFLVIGIVNPERMSADEFRKMAYELSSLTFKVSQSDSLFLSRLLSIPRVSSISFDIGPVEEGRLIMRMKTSRVPVAIYVSYREERAMGTYGGETFQIHYSAEEMTLMMKFISTEDIMELPAV